MVSPKLYHCPAILVSAPASGQGKTTVVAALARYHRNQGRKVRVFKSGPDFLDPMILARASGAPVYQLDLWMVGETQCKQLLAEAAAEADLIIIEGVMGLFDGNPSSADLAHRFGVPILALINAGGMAQTFGAIAHGLATYHPEIPFAGVVANYVASERHAAMLAESVPAGVCYRGAVFHDEGMGLPERHLGLVQAEEVENIEQILDYAAQVIGSTYIGNTGLAELPPTVAFEALRALASSERLLEGCRIGIARDNAFAFIYQANLDLLQAMGAQLCFFSPLDDQRLPEVDSLYFPGGYPELHLNTLADNTELKDGIRAHHHSGKPIIAECGGMLYLMEQLVDKEGNSGEMVGLLSGSGVMQSKLAALGLQAGQFDDGELRGHTFHYSFLKSCLELPIENDLVPALRTVSHPSGKFGEAVYREGALTASYVHWYFPSNPEVVAKLFLPAQGAI